MKPNHTCDPARMALLYIRQQFICTTFKFDAYKKDYIKVDRIVQHEKALMREYVPVISQVEYITSFVNQKTSFELASNFIKETDNLDAIIELEKLINIKLKEKRIK